MTRNRLGRLATVSLGAALLASASLVGGVSGADTRILWIGAPDLTTDDVAPFGEPDNAGILFPTKVSVPGPGLGPYATMFEVQILNGGGQNLANTVLTIDADVQDVATLSLNTIYDPDGGDDASSDFCSIDGDTITCDYASLSAGTERTVAVVVDVTSAYDVATQVTPLFAASVTTNNENGANQQTFEATSGAFGVDAFGADGLNTFLLDGVTAALGTTGVTGSNKLSTNVNFNTANKELVSIVEAAATAVKYLCPAGLDCQPEYSEVTTTTGTFGTAPYFRWTITAIVPKMYALSQGFVAHYPTDALNPDWILPFKSKNSSCGDDIDATIAAQGQCINVLSLTKFDKSSNLLTVEVIMDAQGGMRF